MMLMVILMVTMMMSSSLTSATCSYPYNKQQHRSSSSATTSTTKSLSSSSATFYGGRREEGKKKQCLVIQNPSITGGEICHETRLTENASPSDSAKEELSLLELLSKYHLPFCHHYTLNLLTIKDNYAGNETTCSQNLLPILSQLISLDQTAYTFSCEFNSLVSRYNCQSGFSVKWDCDDCRRTYQEWVCSMVLPYITKGGIQRKPCRELCERVEQRCPYLHPSHKEQYAGEPAFLCIDPTIPFITWIKSAKVPFGDSSKCYDICDFGTVPSERCLSKCQPDNLEFQQTDSSERIHELINNRKESHFISSSNEEKMMSDDFSTLRRDGETANDEKLPFERISNPLPSHSSPFLVHQSGSSTLNSEESIKTSKESVKFDNDQETSSPLSILDDPGTAAQKEPLKRKEFSGRRIGSKKKEEEKDGKNERKGGENERKDGENERKDGENESGNHGDDDSLINAASVIVDDPSYHLHNDLYHLKGDPYTNSRIRETGRNEKNEKATIIPITSTTSSSRNFLQQLSSSQSSPLLPRTTLSTSSSSSLLSVSSPEEAQKLLLNPIINSNNDSTIYDDINFQQNQKSIHPINENKINLIKQDKIHLINQDKIHRINQDKIVKDSKDTDLSFKGLNQNKHNLNPVSTGEHHSPGSEIRAPKLVPMVGYVIRSSSNHNNRDLTHHSHRDEVMNNNNNDNDDLELDEFELSSQTTDPSINSMNKGTTSTPPPLTCSPSFMDGDTCHQKHNPPSSSPSSSRTVSSTFLSSTPHPSSLSSSSEENIVSSEKS